MRYRDRTIENQAKLLRKETQPYEDGLRFNALVAAILDLDDERAYSVFGVLRNSARTGADLSEADIRIMFDYIMAGKPVGDDLELTGLGEKSEEAKPAPAPSPSQN